MLLLLTRWLSCKGTPNVAGGTYRVSQQLLIRVEQQLGQAVGTCATAHQPPAAHRASSSDATAAGPGGGNALNSNRLVLGYLQEELGALSIPAQDLQKLAALELSDAALTAWALTKTHGHPAVEQAAAASQRLAHLLSKLDGAMLRQQAAGSSPTAQLLWHVAVAAAQREARHMPADELQQCVEYQAVQALLRAQGSGEQAGGGNVLQALQEHLPQLTDMSPRGALSHPAFWQLAREAAASSPGLAADLQLLGYHLDAAADAAAGELQQAQQLLGLDAASLQQELVSRVAISPNLLLPDSRQQLLSAASSSTEGRTLLAQLLLLEVMAAALGLSSVQLSLRVSSCELVRRLTGMGQAAPALSQQLGQMLQAAGPSLVTALTQLPAQSLARPSVSGLLQLLQGHPGLKELVAALTSWRAEAAAAGNLPILTSLTQAEVAALSQAQAEAVSRAVMQLEAAGRLLLRKAAAGRLQLAELSGEDAAALAWKVHTGGPHASEELVQLVLAQASEIAAQHHSDADAAASAVASMAASFQLEEVTSASCTAAPPSPYLMAGIPQLQVSEMSQSLLGTGTSSTGSSSRSSSSSSSRSSSSSSAATAEALVRDLALLLAAPGGAPHADSLQAAAARLQYTAHDLPRVLSGPLLELLNGLAADAVVDASSLRRHQHKLRAFSSVVAAELPKLLAAPGTGGDGPGSWAGVDRLPGGSQAAAEGLLELLGEEDARGVVRHAASHGDGSTSDNDHLYGWLADIHHDLDMQRYLQIVFDPQLDVDVVRAPRAWQDPELFTRPPEFLDAMRPLLDTHLAAQGEVPTQDLEWQVYRDAALAESEQAEAAAAAARHAAGHSPFHNSRADEAFLVERLDAGLPRDSVLHAAAHKYLAASFKNRTWRFAQRKRMVDLLIAIGEHLAAHPPRSHRGSPFSALFQPDGPPIVPRTSQNGSGALGSTLAEHEVCELPPGFAGKAAAAH